MQGADNDTSCAELVTAVRSLLEKRAEWRLRTCLVQIDFDRDYDSVLHAAIQDWVGETYHSP